MMSAKTARIPDVLFTVVTLYAISGAVMFPASFFKLFSHYLVQFSLGGAVVVLALVCGRGILLAPRSPAAKACELCRRLPFRFYVTFASAIAFMSAFTAIKTNIPQLVPFYADPYFADFGEWLLGHAPWRIAHRLPREIAFLIDIVYSRLWFGIIFLFILYIAMFENREEFRRFIWNIVLAFIIGGTIMATALSSAGPVFYEQFYDSSRFSGLAEIIRSNPLMEYERLYVEYLYAAYKSGASASGTGISAMPSMRVALAVVIAWYLTSKSVPCLIAGWAFAAFVLFASVYTGWHYLADGLISLIMVSATWLATSKAMLVRVLPQSRKIEMVPLT